MESWESDLHRSYSGNMVVPSWTDDLASVDSSAHDSEIPAWRPGAPKLSESAPTTPQKDIDLEVSSSPRASAFKRIFCAKAPKCVIA